MNIGSWLLLGFVEWCLGFYKTKIATQTDEILLSPPPWIGLLCGYPRSKKLPKGVIQAGGVWLQMTGWLTLIFGSLDSIFIDDPIGELVVIILSLLTSRILTSVIVRKYRYRNMLST
jgi:hypothetical protein